MTDDNDATRLLLVWQVVMEETLIQEAELEVQIVEVMLEEAYQP